MPRLSDFDYNLPKELIAQFPLKARDSARLLVLNRQKGTIEHRIFKDIVEYLRKDDLLILNNTKVLSCRLNGRRLTGGASELLLLERKDKTTFRALIKPSRIKVGEKILFNGGKTFGIISNKNEVTFNVKDADSIYKLGVMPLPPYIKRPPQDSDLTYYQTVYAEENGAIAAPTAGLHFTRELIKNLKSGGINFASITLHVGYGTFKPVKSEDIKQHKMEAEYFRIDDAAVGCIEKARSEIKRTIAVGTTSLRALETYSTGVSEGFTELFIYPGYKFNIVDCLLTNFHLPRTTLYMLVSAFAGGGLIKKAYQEAIDNKYRFYSYGDAMLIV